MIRVEDYVSLDGAVAQAVNSAFARLDEVWNKTPTPLADALSGLIPMSSARWFGYGVSLADAANPTIQLFLSGDEGTDLIDLVSNAVGLRVAVRRDVRFKSLGGGAPVGPAGTVRPGIQIKAVGGTGKSGLGTLGALLQDTQGGTYLLSANHVMAANGAFGNPRILGNNMELSREVRCVDISASQTNQADVAVAKCKQGLSFDPRFPNLRLNAGEATSPVRASTPIRRGTLTGSLIGRFDAFCPQLKIAQVECGIPEAPFANQFLVLDDGGQSFSDEGDSGAIAVAGPDGKTEPLGMLIANGSDSGTGKLYTVVTPFDSVLKAAGEAAGMPLTLMV